MTIEIQTTNGILITAQSECKILQFPCRPGPADVNGGDLQAACANQGCYFAHMEMCNYMCPTNEGTPDAVPQGTLQTSAEGSSSLFPMELGAAEIPTDQGWGKESSSASPSNSMTNSSTDSSSGDEEPTDPVLDEPLALARAADPGAAGAGACDDLKRFTPTVESGCKGASQAPGDGGCNSQCSIVGGGYFRGDLGGCVTGYCACPTKVACADSWFTGGGGCGEACKGLIPPRFKGATSGAAKLLGAKLNAGKGLLKGLGSLKPRFAEDSADADSESGVVTQVQSIPKPKVIAGVAASQQFLQAQEKKIGDI